jgi:hypothetical protein
MDISGSFSYSDLKGFKNYTLPKLQQDLKDAVYEESTYLNKMREKGNVITGETGDYVVPKFLMDKNKNTNWQRLSDPIGFEGVDATRFGKELFGELSSGYPIDYVTMMKNSGPEAVIKYVETEHRSMKETVTETVNTGLISGSGSWPTPTGLNSLIPKTATSGTIHNISRSGKSWIQNATKDSDCSPTDKFGNICILEASKLIKEASKGMSQSKGLFQFAVMDDEVYSLAMYYMPNIASTAPVLVKDAEKDGKYATQTGFMIAGAEAIWDHNAQADSIRYIAKDSVKIHILKGCDFKILPPQQSYNSFSKSVKMGVVLAHVNHNPRRCACHYNFAS